jgi:hypothetical protein
MAGLLVMLTSFCITMAAGNIIWWLVLDKEQRLRVYSWIDLKRDKLVEKLSHKAI